jgi:hypothetical protein
MAWSAPLLADVLSEFNPTEQAAFQSLQGGVNNITAILARVVAEIRDYIRSGGYDLDEDTTTIPLGLYNDAIDLTRWRLLTSAPKLKALQTEERQQACEQAEKKLALIAQQKYAPEPPTAGVEDRGGAWNSENKLIMRTHPVPPPSRQFGPPWPGQYANPDAPADN